ncbi:MAG: SLBB domain-containing protein [Desulfobulbaceae bacterium]|nr:SLBB domain-containing protein [Desulfobulbaceae bacterium]
MKKQIITLGLAVFSLLLLTFSASAEDMYSIGTGDVLRIKVYDHPDLETKVMVNDTGHILMPLLGHVEVKGQTIGNISQKLAALLADGYIIDPQVNVFIEEYGSQKTVILGQVEKPGLYELSGPTTLLEIISKAGGLKENAGHTATIKRFSSKGGKQEIITIDLVSLMEDGDLKQNMQIRGGDNIIIMKAGMCYVTGEVDKPDAYKIDGETTVIKAITLAGGFTGKAAKGSVRIIRKISGQENVMKKVAMDTPIKENDVVVVPESFF